jgi:acyl-CoA synthetase (AMP-forming)/AMP-acid ligase II
MPAQSINTFDQIIRHNAQMIPDRIASRFDGSVVTYGALNPRLNRFVNALSEVGLAKGDRIAFLSRNSHIYIEGILAAARGGFVLTTLNFLLKPDELSYILQHSDARIIFFQPEFAEVVEAIRSSCPALKYFISLGDPVDFAWDYSTFLAAASNKESSVVVHGDDLLLLVYTSGTTGRPKGVMLNHRNVCTNVIDSVRGVALSDDTVNLNVCPLYHVAAIVLQTLTTYCLGGTSVTLDRFDPVTVLKTIEREKITYLFLVPTMLFRMLEVPDADRYDLSSLQRVGYGAAPMPLDRLKRAIALFGPTLFQGYGLTETTANIAILGPEIHDLSAPVRELERLKSCGRAHSGHELSIMNDNGVEVPYGEIGEICVRSDSVMAGYWRDPENTAKAIRDGWLRTGDMAYMDEERYIFIAGRKNDMIKRGGEKIYPQEIEDILFDHPAVLEAAVCGIADPDWGETPRAYIVVRAGYQLSDKELLAHCADRLPTFKCPQDVVFLAELPKTSSGKITRTGLQQLNVSSSN